MTRPGANFKNKFYRKCGVSINIKNQRTLKNQRLVLMNRVELHEHWSLFSSKKRKWSHGDNENGMHMIHE